MSSCRVSTLSLVPKKVLSRRLRRRRRCYRLPDDLLDRFYEVLRPDGLDESRPRSGRLRCIEVLGQAGHGDDRGVGIVPDNASDEAQPVQFGHPKIRDHQRDVVVDIHLDGGFTVARENGGVPCLLDDPARQKPVHFFIIDYQYVGHGARGSEGAPSHTG